MPDATLHIDALFVAKQMARLLSDYPELAYDETLARDMMEGATDLHDVIRRALNERADAAGMADAIKARKSELTERQQRFERKADAMERLIHNLLTASGQKGVTLPEATISVREAKPRVEVDDVDALPQGFFKTERVAKKTEIGDALRNGEPVPGAHLEPGIPGITVRTK